MGTIRTGGPAQERTSLAMLSSCARSCALGAWLDRRRCVRGLLSPAVRASPALWSCKVCGPIRAASQTHVLGTRHPDVRGYKQGRCLGKRRILALQITLQLLDALVVLPCQVDCAESFDLWSVCSAPAISRTTSLNTALTAGSNFATDLSLNACVYCAQCIFHRRHLID